MRSKVVSSRVRGKENGTRLAALADVRPRGGDTDGKAPSHPKHREVEGDEGHETGIRSRMAFDQQPDTDGDGLTNQQACEEYKQQPHDLAPFCCGGLGGSARTAKGSIVARRSVAPAAAGTMSQRRVAAGGGEPTSALRRREFISLLLGGGNPNRLTALAAEVCVQQAHPYTNHLSSAFTVKSRSLNPPGAI